MVDDVSGVACVVTSWEDGDDAMGVRNIYVMLWNDRCSRIGQ